MPENIPNLSAILPPNIKPPIPNSWNREALPHKFCPGCGDGYILKLFGQILDEQIGEAPAKIRIYRDTSCWSLTDGLLTYPVTEIGYDADPAKVFEADKFNILLVGEEGSDYTKYLHLLRRTATLNIPLFAIATSNGTGGGYPPHPDIAAQPDPNHHAAEQYVPALQDRLDVLDMILKISGKGYVSRGSIARLGQLKSSIRKGFDTIKQGNPAFIEILSVCPYFSMLDAKMSIKLMDEQLLLYEVKDYRG